MSQTAVESAACKGVIVDINKLKTRPAVSDQPIFSLKETAKQLKVHPQTLRKYMEAGLIRPVRQGSHWKFSQKDIMWGECLRTMIHEKKLSIPGIRKLLQIVPCWMAASCPVEIQCHCPAQVDWSQPRRLELMGGRASPRLPEAVVPATEAEQESCCAREIGAP